MSFHTALKTLEKSPEFQAWQEKNKDHYLVHGLILSFTSLAGADAAAKGELLATGISTAMNTTAFGLIVAIPCLVAYAILTNKEMDILRRYEDTVNRVLFIFEHGSDTTKLEDANKKNEESDISAKESAKKNNMTETNLGIGFSTSLCSSFAHRARNPPFASS